MPITWNCTCRKSLRVADELAGRRVRCPECNTISTAPKAADPGFEVVEDTELPPSPPPPAKSAPTRVRATVSEEVEGPRKRSRVDDDDEEERPRKKRRDNGEDDEERTRKKRRDNDDEDERPWKKRRDEDDEDEE